MFSVYIICILVPCLSPAGFVCAVIPGTEGPPPSSPDVSLLAHPSRRQPAVEGEMQGRGWVLSPCSRWTTTLPNALHTAMTQPVLQNTFRMRTFSIYCQCVLSPTYHLPSINRHRWASTCQEEEARLQAWLHSQPLEECLHQATQNRH